MKVVGIEAAVGIDIGTVVVVTHTDSAVVARDMDCS